MKKFNERQIQDLLAIESKYETFSHQKQVAIAMNISEAQLQRRIYQGSKAKNQMVQANLRLVASMAKHYQERGVPDKKGLKIIIFLRI